MAFNFYKSCTIQTGKVPSSQSSFPALLPFISSDANLKTVGNGGHVQNANGFDIRPFSDSGLSVPLTYQLVSYDATLGIFEMWVNMTAVDGAVVYVGYGDNTLTTDGSSNTTWPSQYKGVYHWGDGNTISLNDSTSNALNGSWVNADHSIPIFGPLGGALQIVHNDDSISFGSGAFPTTGSMSFWYYPTWLQNDGIGHNLGFSIRAGNVFQVLKYSDNSLYGGWYNGSDGRVIVANANYTLNQNQWNHFVLTWDKVAPATKLYLNGSQIGTTNTTDGTWTTTGTTIYNLYDTAFPITGTDKQDELRFTNSVLSANWITTEYNNQANLSTFWTKSSEFSGGGGGAVVVPQIMNSFKQRR